MVWERPVTHGDRSLRPRHKLECLASILPGHENIKKCDRDQSYDTTQEKKKDSSPPADAHVSRGASSNVTTVCRRRSLTDTSSHDCLKNIPPQATRVGFVHAYESPSYHGQQGLR